MSKKSKKLEINSEAKVAAQPTTLSDSQVFIVLAITCFLLYARTLSFGFTYLDDNVLILDNLTFLQNLGNLSRAFTQEVFHILHSSASYYRPILTISFMLDAVVSGSSPFVYHLSNILYHLTASFLVFKLFRKLKHSTDLSFLFSLIFAVHPVLTQAVAWVPGRNDSLLTIFALAVFITFINYWEGKSTRSLVWSLLFFALALFTKETALVIPVICALYSWMVAKIGEVKKIGWFLTGWGIIGLVWASLRHTALGNNPLPLTPLEMVNSVFLNSPALIQFGGKILFPFNLSVLPIMQDTSFIWGILAVSLFGVLSWRGKSRKMLFFGLVWFLAFLLPSFIRPSASTVADFIEHRVYLPIIGLFIILAETSWLNSFDFQKKVYLFPSLGILTLFFVLNFSHQGNFANRLSFWQNAAATSPHSPLAQRNLGAMYYLDGKIDLAEVYYRKALDLNPTEQMVHNNLGLIYAARGQAAVAFEEYQAELAINPSYDNAHFNLGLL